MLCKAKILIFLKKNVKKLKLNKIHRMNYKTFCRITNFTTKKNKRKSKALQNWLKIIILSLKKQTGNIFWILQKKTFTFMNITKIKMNFSRLSRINVPKSPDTLFSKWYLTMRLSKRNTFKKSYNTFGRNWNRSSFMLKSFKLNPVPFYFRKWKIIRN